MKMQLWCRRLAIKSITELSVSSPGKKGSKLSQQIPAAEFVLESFGNAKTLHDSSALRYNRLFELQCSERWRTYGAEALAFGLDRS